jgi:hypothetical protein
MKVSMTAGRAAIKAQTKLDRLKSSILNIAAKPASSTLEEDSPQALTLMSYSFLSIYLRM